MRAPGLPVAPRRGSSKTGGRDTLVWTTVVQTFMIHGMATMTKTCAAGAQATPSDPSRKPHGFDSLEQQAFLNLWRTYDRLKALEDALFGRHDLTAQQYNALRLLRAEHPAGLQTLALAGRLISRSPDITRLIDKLDERGLVERHRPAGNRRVVQVAITPPGWRCSTN